MSNIVIHANDSAKIVDSSSLSNNAKNIINQRFKGGPQKTKITFINHDTGEVLGEYQNKVVITGSQLNACAMFGLDPVVKFPTYNSEMRLDNSADPDQKPKNYPLISLFCVSDSGCGATPKDVFISKYTDRIKPAPAEPSTRYDFTSDMIMPFRFVDEADDLNDDLRQFYFGRKTFSEMGKIGYYFKRFDTDPQMHLKYADGTDITPEMYEVESDQLAECFVEMRLRITRLDFRDYFEQVLGWDKARISSLSLCTAWYDDEIDQYRYYQDITPYSYLGFSFQQLVSSDVSIDIMYDIYY